MTMTRYGKGLMHAAVSGEFGEALIRLELSRAGWPLALPCPGVAIDVLAVAPSGRRVGITVKCRDRKKGNPSEGAYIFREKGNRSAADEIERYKEVCDLLGAEPWIAVVTLTREYDYVHLISLVNYEKKYMSPVRNKAWQNTPKWRKRYAADPNVLGNKEPGKPGNWIL